MKQERDRNEGSSKHYEGWGKIIYEISDFNISTERRAGYLFLRLFSFVNLFKTSEFLPFDVVYPLHF